MTARSYVEAAWVPYKAHVWNGGVPPTLPIKEPHDPSRSEGLVFPSDLGKCPKAAALKRQQAPERFPIDPITLAGYAHKGDLGNYFEKELIAALIFQYGEKAVLTHVSAEGFGARGRIDAILTVDGQDYLLEIKSSAPFGRNSRPTPSISNVLQALYYRMIVGEMPTSIVLFNRWHSKGLPFETWDIIPKDDGFILVDEDGVPSGAYWNRPELLNYEGIRAEIDNHRQYLIGNRSDNPMPDFLNHPERWQCGSIPKGSEPKFYTSMTKALQYSPNKPAVQLPDGRFVVPGVFKPTCPYFCHTDAAELPIVADEQERFVPAWEMESF